MLTGYNSNVTYNKNTYHVQTENGGTENPFITTFIYLKGAIVASKKIPYSDILQDVNAEETIRQLMENQHKNMIKSLLAGRLNV
jgi:hypothetical protein